MPFSIAKIAIYVCALDWNPVGTVDHCQYNWPVHCCNSGSFQLEIKMHIQPAEGPEDVVSGSHLLLASTNSRLVIDTQPPELFANLSGIVNRSNEVVIIVGIEVPKLE